MAPDRTREVVIGLDVGTTNVKAVAFGLGWDADVTAVRAQQVRRPEPGRHEQDPSLVADACLGALRECVERLEGVTVVGVAVATAMHALLGLDGSGRPLTPVVTWADDRALAEARALRATPEGPALHRATGTPVHPMSPLVKLRWFAAHQPEVCRAVRRWVGLKEWVLLALTGEVATELSSASGTGLLDLERGTWSAAALAAAGIEESALAPVLPTTATLALSPSAASAAGLPEGTPVITGAADGPAASLGVGAVEEGVVGLSIGTSAALRAAVPRPTSDEEGLLFCYALTDDCWVVGGALSDGGTVARWAASTLAPDIVDADGEPDRLAVLELAATAPVGCDGLVMVPYLQGPRAPRWDAGLRGAYLGLRTHHTRAHLARAAVEGVCLQLRAVLDRIDALAPVRSIRATGGALAEPLWADVLAPVLDRPITVEDEVAGTALGAAALGLVGLDRAATPAEAAATLRSDDDDRQPLPVDPADVAAYRDVRASVLRYVEDLLDTARLLPPT